MQIQERVPLAPFTSFRIGGRARFFCSVNTKEELGEAVAFSRTHKIPLRFLGKGTNMLIADEGFEGLVIRLDASTVHAGQNMIEADAGVTMPRLAAAAADASLQGLEWAVGVPGTVGGSVRGNAGAFGRDVSGCLVSCVVYELNQEVIQERVFQAHELQFGYRTSLFKHHPEWIVARGTFSASQGEKTQIQEVMRRIMRERKVSQGLEYPSAGCVFQNTMWSKLNEEALTALQGSLDAHTFNECKERKMVPSSLLIDRAGLKGKTVGGARVSQVHANFILNTGNATAREVRALIKQIKEKVWRTYRVALHEEIAYLGFDSNQSA